MPGSGKSFIWENMKKKLSSEKEWTFDSVSSDGIRGEQMEEYIQKGLSKDEAYNKT